MSYWMFSDVYFFAFMLDVTKIQIVFCLLHLILADNCDIDKYSLYGKKSKLLKF